MEITEEVKEIRGEKIKEEEKKVSPKQRFKRALAMLNKSRPFIRGVVSRCKPTFNKEIPTACVQIRPSRRFKMYFNPDFVDQQRYTEHVSGVINHEINHMMRGHLTIDRTGLDVEVLNLTLEVHANMDIPRSWLPPQTEDGEALTHEHFNLDKDLRDWKDIYAVMIKRFNKKKNRKDKQKKELKATGIAAVIKGAGTGHTETPQTSKKMSKKLKKKLTSKPEVNNMLAKVLNKVWKEQVDDVIKKGEDPEMSEEEANTLKDALSQIPGLLPGMREALLVDVPSKIRWEQHLRHFVCTIKKRSSSYRKMNKRFPDMMGIVPGRDFKSGKCNLFIGIDTSGSCCSFVPSFVSEIKKLARHADGIVVEHDAAIMDTYRLKDAKKKKNFRGGGGTDFSKILTDEAILKVAKQYGVKKFDGIVFLTDLWAHFPTTSPSAPILFFVPDINTNPQPPFGKFVKMEV